jgi:nucleoside-diphosphate kinase
MPAVQRTLILFKPDALQKGVCGKVLSRFEEAGFTIRACKMLRLNKATLREHYAHIADLPFYPQVERFMQTSPVIAMVIEGNGAIERAREMIGVTDSRKAAPGTIRAEFGEDQMVNVCHASDSEEMARVEIERFFGPEEIFD